MIFRRVIIILKKKNTKNDIFYAVRNMVNYPIFETFHGKLSYHCGPKVRTIVRTLVPKCLLGDANNELPTLKSHKYPSCIWCKKFVLDFFIILRKSFFFRWSFLFKKNHKF